VHACGPIITAKGGYPLVGVKSAPALEVRGASDASEKTRDFILRENPDCIKIAVERGFLQDLSDDGWPALEEAEVEAIVRQAHARGLRVTAHVTQQEEFERAVRAGAGVIAHAPIERLTDDALQLAADRGVVMVSTLALWSDSTLQSAAAQNLVRYVRRGGRVAIGSDYPNWTKPGLPIAELRTLAAAGLSRKELLIALSRNTVSQNATDFVVLQSDPLQSLEALTDVDLVIRGGAVVFSSTELHRPARQ
jgi:imidazolonepropionase-like amidohydrolase